MLDLRSYKNFLRKFEPFLKARVKQHFSRRCVDHALCEQAKGAILNGGKRLRPYLAYIAYNLHVQKWASSIELLRLGVALEAIHAFLLVQDDIMDRAYLRRGKPAVFRVFEKEYQDLHTGESLGILASDLIYNFALKTLAGMKIKLLGEVLDFIDDTINGQYLDVVAVFKDWSEEIVFKIYKLKTSKYSVIMPLSLGARLRGKKLDRWLIKFAEALGVAYQISDDIIGAFGDKKRSGKDADSDFKEGKRTVLTVYAYNKLKDPRELTQLLGDPELSSAGADKIRQILRETGALDYAKDLLDKYYADALESLRKSNISTRAKEELSRLAEFVVKRDY